MPTSRELLVNSSWTEWSTNQEVITREISKLDAGRQFNIMTFKIVSITNVGIRSYGNFFGVKMSVMLFISFENCGKKCEGSHEWPHN